MNCIVVDIGNTCTKLGLLRSGRIMRVSKLIGCIHDKKRIKKEVLSVLRNTRIEGVVLSSVVPKSTGVWSVQLRDLVGYKPLIVNHRLKLGVKISYPKPAEIGSDRLANASGASVKYGAPVIIADFGTALTFDVVSSKNQYLGGVIAPGLPLMMDYLYEKTALLPKVRLRGMCSIVGKSTEGAMRIGARVGYRGIVREIISHLRSSEGLRNAVLCVTGGDAKWALLGVNIPFHYDPHITLFGLNRILELNIQRTKVS